MPNTRSTKTSWDGPFRVVGFAGACWILFGLVNVFHIHGWNGFGLALVTTVLLFAVGKIMVRRIVAATELGRRDPRNLRGDSRAKRRERSRQHK